MDSIYAWFCRYTPAIEAINEKLRAYAQLNTRIDFVDCTASFVEDDDRASARSQPCSVMLIALHHIVACFMQPKHFYTFGCLLMLVQLFLSSWHSIECLIRTPAG